MAILAVLLPFSEALAQSAEAEIDSLQQVFQAAEGKSEIVDAAKALGKYYFPQELDSVVKYQGIAVDQLAAGGPTMEEVNLRVRRSAALTYLGEKEAALSDLDKAREMSFTLGDSSDLPNIFNIMGVVQKDMGQHEKAIESFHQGLEIAEFLKDTVLIGKLYTNKGVVYAELGDTENSLKNYHLGTTFLEQTDDLANLAVSYNNLAASYADQGNYKMAIPYYEKGLDLAQQTGDSSTWVYPLVNLGTGLGQIGQFQRATESLELALHISEGLNRPDLLTVALLAIGEFELKQGKKKVAKARFERAIQITEESETPSLMLYAYESLVSVLVQTNDYQGAYEWQKELITVKDSLLDKDRIQQSQELQVKYDTQKKETENNRLMLEQERADAKQRQSYGIMILGGSVALTIIIFLFVNFRRKVHHNQELSEKSKLIEEQNTLLQSKNEALHQLDQEKNALMGIVAHDLKAPLSKAGALLSVLQSKDASRDEIEAVSHKMKHVFAEGQSLIAELVLLNKLESGQGEVANEKIDVAELAHESMAPFYPLALKKGIDLHVEIPTSIRPFPVYGPYLARIIDNLVSNALKFSPPGTQVWVSLKTPPGTLELEVRDEGPGFKPEEIPQIFEKFSRLSNRPTGGENSTGLGLSIVKGLADSMGGTVEVTTKAGSGTRFEVQIPEQ